MARASLNKTPPAQIRIGVAKNAVQMAETLRQAENTPGVSIGWKQIWCAGYDVDAQGTRHYHHIENIPCKCDPGPHSQALSSYADEILCGGGKGSGKGQPLWAKVHTPHGWVEMGSLKVGQAITNPDGSVARVLQIHPLGVRKIYRVTFQDGGVTHVTEDHKWKVQLKPDGPFDVFDTSWLRRFFKMDMTLDMRYFGSFGVQIPLPEPCPDHLKTETGTRRMVSIEEAGEEEAQCISVDHPNGLYITDDYIVTHNSDNTFGFILRGNLSAWRRKAPPRDGMRVGQKLKDPMPSHTDVSYVNNPNYTFLVVRRTAKDLDDWFRRFKILVEPMGADCTTSPMRVTFPSGATGYFGHLEDRNSIMALQGKRFVRIVVEEITQIEEESFYQEAIFLACGSAWDDLHPQIMATCNPGGPGEAWVISRFMEPERLGERWPEGRLFRHLADIDNRRVEMTRAYFLSTINDNPYYLQGQGKYAAALSSLKRSDETMYRRYYLGEFGVTEGLYFSHFRKAWRGPSSGEPENAVHVVQPIQIAPWWPRAVSLDWGYSHDSAVYWGTWTPKHQLHVYREMVRNRIGTVELGARIAEQCVQDFQNMIEPRMNLYLSHDAFHRTDYRTTEAEQIQQGIQSVLGQDSVFVMAPTLDEEDLPKEQAWEAVKYRLTTVGKKAALTLLPAGGAGKRKPGWQLIREYLRWWKLQELDLDDATMQQILQKEGTLALKKIIAAQDAEASRVLPVLQIGESCKRLIRWLEIAKESERDPEDVEKADGDDPGDSLNYLVSNFTFAAGEKPKDVWLAEQVALRVPDGAGINQRIRAYEFAEAEWKKKGAGGVVAMIPRFQRRMKAGRSGLRVAV